MKEIGDLTEELENINKNLEVACKAIKIANAALERALHPQRKPGLKLVEEKEWANTLRP
jgi:hypothetical protein